MRRLVEGGRRGGREDKWGLHLPFRAKQTTWQWKGAPIGSRTATRPRKYLLGGFNDPCKFSKTTWENRRTKKIERTVPEGKNQLI